MKIEKALFGIEENEKISVKKIIYIFTICLFAILVNFLGSKLAEHISFPLYLDSLLTIGVVALCGLIPGIFCAFFSNVVLSISTHSTLLFSICHICTAVVAWIVFYIEENSRKSTNNKQLSSLEYSVDAFLWAGLAASIINGMIGNAIAALVFAANPGRPSANVVFQGIYVAFPNLSFANNFGGYLENLVDKTISALLSLFMYKTVKKFNR